MGGLQGKPLNHVQCLSTVHGAPQRGTCPSSQQLQQATMEDSLTSIGIDSQFMMRLQQLA
jgi:hypothetical protein